MKILYPEQYAETAFQVDYEVLRQKGVRLLMFDVDNTLETYNTTLPSRETRQWVPAAQEAGIPDYIGFQRRRETGGTFCCVIGRVLCISGSQAAAYRDSSGP